MNKEDRSDDTGERQHPPLTKSNLIGAHDLPDSLKSLPGGKIYASNGPRIMLEIITARSAAIIIALTWVVFIICFSIDFYLTYKSFHSSNYVLNSFDCSAYNLTATEEYPQFSCANNAQGSWNATVRELSNVISFSMSVQQVNMSSLVANRTSNSATFGYNLQVWTCYNNRGCGNNFDYSETYTQDANVWQKVLTLQDATIDVDFATALVSDGAGDKKISLQLIANTFQNQESIPTNGLVKSYFIILEYTLDPFGLFVSTNLDQQAATTYNLNVVRAPGNRVLAGINIALLIITLAVLGLYCYILFKNIGSLSRWKHALSEQKWVIMYFFLVILFQNPVYCVIFWYTDQPPVTAAYATFLINYIAQSGLFTLWLLFAHSYQRKLQRKSFFYGPKVFIGVTIFVFGVLILTYQFPSLTLPKTNRSSVQAVENWSHTLKISFVVCTIIYLTLIMLWTIIWFVRLVLSGRMMNRLPYMSTRYMQLSFRFFSLQATLVTIYYIAQYILVAYFISRDSTPGYATSLSDIADNINVMFRQQFQLFGKTFFLTTYAMVLAFMFLPPDMLDSTGFYTTIAATYAISEDEHKEVVHGRKLAIKNVKRNLINQVTRYDQLIRAKEDVFCVDLALKMRNISFQAYYDRVDGAQTASSFGTTQDIGNLGFELIEEFYDPTHEVYCIIARETISVQPQDRNATAAADAPPAETRIVVAFRGTASKRQMEDNMNYSQRSVDFHNLDIPSLDHLDRLNIPASDPSEDMELESVDGDDEDDATPITSLSTAYLQRMLTQHILAQNSYNNVDASSPKNQEKPGAVPRPSSYFRPSSLSLFSRPMGIPAPTVHTSSTTSVTPHFSPETPLSSGQRGANLSNNNSLLNSTESVTRRSMHSMTVDEEKVARCVLGLRKQRPRHQYIRSPSNRDKHTPLPSDHPSYQEENVVHDIENHFVSHDQSSTVSPFRTGTGRKHNVSDDPTNLNSNNAAGGAAVTSVDGAESGTHVGIISGETIINRAGQVGGNITNFLSDAVGATNQGIDLVVGATTGVMQKAAKHTPGLKKFVIPNVHVGFWDAYTVVRGFLHGVLRAELMKKPCNVIFTGHSLGGALATFAALDFKLTSLPRINAYLKFQAKKQLNKLQQMDLHSNLHGTATSNLTSNSPAKLNERLGPPGITTSTTLNNHNTSLALRAAIFPQLTAPRSYSVPQNNHPGDANTRLSHDGGDLNDKHALSDDEIDEDIEQHGEQIRFRPTGVNNASSTKQQKPTKFLPRFQLFGTQNESSNLAEENEVSQSPSAGLTDANPLQSNANGAWGNFLSTQHSHLRQALHHTLGGGSHLPHQAVFIKKIQVMMYNFGSPRVGNFAFQQLYDKEIPRSYRVVVDGDLVPGLPPSGYRHVGTEILIDSLGVGTIIIDPSFVERWLRTHLKSSISVHSLLVYRKGLLGVKLSAEQMRAYASEKQIEDIDPTRLALAWRNRVQIEKMVENETTVPAVDATVSGKMNNVKTRKSISSTNASPELPHVQYSPLQTPKETKHNEMASANVAVTTSEVSNGSPAKESGDKATTFEAGIAAESTNESSGAVMNEDRSQSFHSQHSDEGIALRSVSLMKPVSEEELNLSKSQTHSTNPTILHKHGAEGQVVVGTDTITEDATSESPASETEEAKKARLIRQRLMQGRQEEEYYDHTERDYEALMGQIRHLKGHSQWHQKVKLVPKFLGLQHTKKAPTSSSSYAASSHSGNVSSISNTMESISRDSTVSAPSANSPQYKSPTVISSAAEHK